MGVSTRSGTILVVVVWLIAIVRSENVSDVDTGELVLIERIENSTIQAIKLLNDMDAYEMATTLSDSVEDILKLFDDLGPLFRNGTLATYMCTRGFCDIYALPNGSVPLKKSVIKLLLDVFDMTQAKYGDEVKVVRMILVGSWFPPRAGDGNWGDLRYMIVDAFYGDVIHMISSGYKHYLRGYLRLMAKSTWQNNTGRNLTTCFPNFLIRYNDYNESVYKTFVKELSTFIYHEITMIGLCIGISGEDNVEREKKRRRLTEKIREIMEQITDARSVLNEGPPTKPTQTTGPFADGSNPLPSSESVQGKVRNALADAGEDIMSLPWKERPRLYDKVIHNAIRTLKLSSDNASVNGVIYLPYETAKRGMHCAHATDNGSYPGSIEERANYFVKYMMVSAASQKLKEEFKALEANKESIVKTVFAEDHDDLCERVLVAFNDQRSKRKRREVVSDAMRVAGFSTFVAVKCSYDFVWYELGWRYYTAARTTSDYMLEANDGTYKNNCGQIILFP